MCRVCMVIYVVWCGVVCVWRVQPTHCRCEEESKYRCLPQNCERAVKIYVGILGVNVEGVKTHGPQSSGAYVDPLRR